ncbi:MAG TPA: hypothetical protein EYH40_01930 [Desulfurococcales archaeon]|nr:hypothetical protein [Desulfurococcales archaeon]
MPLPEIPTQTQNVTLENGEVLIVGGPATINVKKGSIRILGRVFSEGEKVVVHTTKSYSVVCEDKPCEVEVIIGSSGFTKKTRIQDDNIYFWEKIANEILTDSSKNKKMKVIIIGDVESGKTSLSTLIANMAHRKGLKTAIIDADVGQADIGPPTCISLGIVEKPILKLSDVKLVKSCFVGSITPCNSMDKLLTCLSQLLNHAYNIADIIIIDTDGWIKSTEAIESKINIIKLVKPDYILLLKKANDSWISRLEEYLKQCKKIKCITLPTPSLIKIRNREFRKSFREHGYSRFLKNLQSLTVKLNSIKIINSELFNGIPLSNEELNKIKNILNVDDNTILYGEKSNNKAIIVLSKRVEVGSEQELKIKETLGVFRVEYRVQGFEQGIVVGLLDENLEDLGIGIIESIDFKNMTMKILVPKGISPSLISVGQIKLHIKNNGICEEYKIKGKPL